MDGVKKESLPVSAKKIETVILDETVLLPRAWEQPGEYSCFNPALTRFRKRWLLVYRCLLYTSRCV